MGELEPLPSPPALDKERWDTQPHSGMYPGKTADRYRSRTLGPLAPHRRSIGRIALTLQIPDNSTETADYPPSNPRT